MTADLSNEALDALEKDLRRKVTLGTGVVTPLRIQAADAITALRAENEKHRHQATRAIDGWSKSQDREIAALERATAAEAALAAAMEGAVECGEGHKCPSGPHGACCGPPTAQADPVTLTYRNWRGEVSDRTITPRRVWFGSTEWHPEPQWLLTAWDAEKNAERDFALADFLGRPGERDALIEALRDLIKSHAEICVDLDVFESKHSAREALVAAENKKAGVGERSSAMTALAVRDSKMRTKVMREAMAIIAKIERDEMADSDGILPPDRFDEGTSAAYEAIEDAIRVAEKEARG